MTDAHDVWQRVRQLAQQVSATYWTGPHDALQPRQFFSWLMTEHQAWLETGEIPDEQRARIEALIDASSFGEPDAKALRSLAPPGAAERAVARARELNEADQPDFRLLVRQYFYTHDPEQVNGRGTITRTVDEFAAFARALYELGRKDGRYESDHPLWRDPPRPLSDAERDRWSQAVRSTGHLDWRLVERSLAYTGHIEEMPDEERVWLLGALTTALMRHLTETGCEA